MLLERIRSDSQQLTNLTSNFHHPAYLHYPNHPGLAQFISCRDQLALIREENLGLLAIHDDTPTGLLWACLSDWDSEKLGVSMAKADILVTNKYDLSALTMTNLLNAVDDWACKMNVAHLAIRINFEEKIIRTAIESAGFHIVDVMLVQKLEPITMVLELKEAIYCRLANKQDATAFKNDVDTLYADSRYHVDGGFNPSKLKTLYVDWLQTAFDGGADQVIVAELNEQVVGFVTCYLEREYTDFTGVKLGFIGLLGALPAARGKNVGKSLIESAKKWFKEQGIQVVTVATQITNYAGLGAYQASGFRPLTALATYHRWRS